MHRNEVAAMKQHFAAVSLSGGKDSTALLLLMIERGLPIDIVISADTGMEFPEMYEHLAKVDAYLYQKRGLHITTLRHPKGFEWLMFDEPKSKLSAIEKRKAEGVVLKGNGWPGVKVRWCTGQLKTHCRFVMIEGLILAAYIRFIIVPPVGAALFKESKNCVSCANIIRNYGCDCWKWIKRR